MCILKICRRNNEYINFSYCILKKMDTLGGFISWMKAGNGIYFCNAIFKLDKRLHKAYGYDLHSQLSKGKFIYAYAFHKNAYAFSQNTYAPTKMHMFSIEKHMLL